MDTKRTIRKLLFITMWVVIGGGMITLLAAAMRKQKNDRCAGYDITIKGPSENFFVDEKDVTKLLTQGSGGKIKGQPMASLKLRKLEQLLEDNIWIKDAELYFDNKDVLHVKIMEREPVARIFTTAGKSFYIDNEVNRMPLSDKISARVPVFTGFPDKKMLTRKDSALLQDINATASFVQADPFWQAQVAQINITPQRDMEMVPVVGNHIVRLGKGNDIEKKFHRLFIFYKNVLSQTGFDKYKEIDVQFTGQVIGVKGSTAKTDSVQLRRNVEKLLQQARDMQNQEIVIPPTITRTETANSISNENNSNANPNPVKLSQDSLPKQGTVRQPKAVMKPRSN